MDIQLVAADGTVLLDYASWYNAGQPADGLSDPDEDGLGELFTWAEPTWCYDCPFALTWTYHGMTMRACVDECVADLGLVYHDGTVFELEGSLFLSEEWVYIDVATEEITLNSVSYASGSGELA